LPKDKRELPPLRVFKGHTAWVEDVAWHTSLPHFFASVGDDKKLMLWDTRNPSDTKAASAIEAHSREVNCVAFSPKNENVLLTGSADKVCVIPSADK
jgi:histone-binding protein RBBP4